MPNRWTIVAIAATVEAAMIAVTLGVTGWNVEGTSAVVRLTARVSLVLFLLAFVARPLRQLVQTPATKWMLANRRYLGVSFAVSHGMHLAAIISLGDRVGLASYLIGSPGYLFLIPMAITSFDGPTKWLGRKRWNLLHTAGMYVLWGSFAFTYVGRAFVSPVWIPLAVITVAALVPRIVVLARR
jgi:DMSO/TMAO reductase YedYZ heme-binding membrane subunit